MEWVIENHLDKGRNNPKLNQGTFLRSCENNGMWLYPVWTDQLDDAKVFLSERLAKDYKRRHKLYGFVARKIRDLETTLLSQFADEERTGWFYPWIRPVHIGVYEILQEEVRSRKLLGVTVGVRKYYAAWNRKSWMIAHGSIAEAASEI